MPPRFANQDHHVADHSARVLSILTLFQTHSMPFDQNKREEFKRHGYGFRFKQGYDQIN